MQELINQTLTMWWELFVWMAWFMAAFTLLAKWMPCNPTQPVVTKAIVTDMIYFFVMPVLTRFVRILFISAGIYVVYNGVSEETVAQYFTHGYGPLGELPLWLQSAIIFIVSDIILYWMHRLFHTGRFWPFHAIHHSPREIYWHSTYRFHPVNSWFTFTLVDTIMLLSGFSVAAVTLMGSFNMIYSAMVHANLNWTFGPFRYLFASPVFHRWHHTAQAEGMDKNFAPTFPLLDILFGTFYMPEGRVPERYGVPGSDIPEDFIGQMFWPFKRKKT